MLLVPAVFPDVVRSPLHGEDHGIRPAVHEFFTRIKELSDKAVPFHRAVGHQGFGPEIPDLADAGHLKVTGNLLPGKNRQRVDRGGINDLRRAKLLGVFFCHGQEILGKEKHVLDS